MKRILIFIVLLASISGYAQTTKVTRFAKVATDSIFGNTKNYIAIDDTIILKSGDTLYKLVKRGSYLYINSDSINLSGTGTVTNIATGWGLTGGPVTTTGTVAVDTSEVATLYDLTQISGGGDTTKIPFYYNAGVVKNRSISTPTSLTYTTGVTDPFTINGNISSFSDNSYLLRADYNVSNTSAELSHRAGGMLGEVYFTPSKTATFNEAVGVYGYVKNSGTGNVTKANGVRSIVYHNSTDTIGSSFNNLSSYVADAGGVTTLNAGVYVQTPALSSGSKITTNYGLYLLPQSGIGITTAYGIYQGGGAETNYFNGYTNVDDSLNVASGSLRVPAYPFYSGYGKLSIFGHISAFSLPDNGCQIGVTNGSGAGLFDNTGNLVFAARATNSNAYGDIAFYTGASSTERFSIRADGSLRIASPETAASTDTILSLTNNEIVAVPTSGLGFLTGNQSITLSGDVSGSGTTAITATVADDSHNHVISNVDYLQDSLTDNYNKRDTVTVLLSRARATSTYEPKITAGTTGQYWRGDKSWQTLNATAVGLGNVTNNAQVTSVTGSGVISSSGGTTPAISLSTSGASNGYSMRYISNAWRPWPDSTAAGGSMTYPGAGIPVSTGSAWGTSITGSNGQSLRYISGAWRAWADSVSNYWSTGGDGIYYGDGSSALGLGNDEPVYSLDIYDATSRYIDVKIKKVQRRGAYLTLQSSEVADESTGAEDTLGVLAFQGQYYDGSAFDAGFSAGIGVVATTEVFTSTACGGDLFIATTPAEDTTMVERVRVTSDGDVGIGTTDPDSTLHVVGDGHFSDNLRVEGKVTTSTLKVTGLSTDSSPDSALSLVNGEVKRAAWPSGGSGTATDVQVFTTPGSNTWTKPSSAVWVEVICVSGGGGGGSGRKGADGTVRCGGGGAGGGGYSKITLNASVLGATETAFVGSGGTGGASQTTNSTDGLNGSHGTASYFGNYIKSAFGARGLAGTASTGSAGGGGGGNFATGGSGGTASTTGGVGTQGSVSQQIGTSGGASGGGISSGNAASNGGTGGANALYYYGTVAGGTAGSSGGNGGNGNTMTGVYLGTGGGGGASSITGNAGIGGDGGNYGGGGGGGGAALNDTGNSGKGGDGADGIVIVITYF